MDKRVSRDTELSYAFDPAKKPVLRVDQGERFVVETEDNLSGRVRSEKDLPTDSHLEPFSGFSPPKHNPMSGPIWVKGAHNGDILEVSIEKIVPADHGISCIFPGVGPMCDSMRWPELAGPYTKVIRHIPGPSGDMSDGKAVYNEKIEWDLRPFVGTIGIAAEYEVHSSLLGQGPWGGNWDCRDIAPGNRLLLPCFHEGALLYLGDVHAGQGDAEWMGTADEVRAEVTLSCRVIKNRSIPYARIVREDAIISICSDKPLEEAIRRATLYLMEWMIDEYRFTPKDAYIVISANPDFRVNVYQMVLNCPGLSYTAGALLPKKYLAAPR